MLPEISQLGFTSGFLLLLFHGTLSLLNGYIDLSDMSNPIIGGMQFGSAIIYNNRRIIKELSVFGGVIGVGVAALVSG